MLFKMRTIKGIMKAAKPAVELVELAGAVAVVGSAAKDHGPKALNFFLETVGVKKKAPPTAGAIDIPDDDRDDCALANSEIVVTEVDTSDCACKGGGNSAAPPAPSAPPAPPVAQRPTITIKPRTPCSVSRAASPPPASESPTGQWQWIAGAWLPGPGYACKDGVWILGPVSTRPVPSTAPPAKPAPKPSTVPSTAPLRGADTTVDVCPSCATGPIVAKAGTSLRLKACESHAAIGRANAEHVESMTRGWAQSWELGDASAAQMPNISDPKYIGVFGAFKADDYIADMRAFHASLTPGSAIPASVKPDLLAKVAIYALNRQGKRYSDEAVATRELMASATGPELDALRGQLAEIDISRGHVDALLAKLKNPAPSEAADAQAMATDIVTAAKSKGGLDDLFKNLNAAAQAQQAQAQQSQGPAVVLNVNQNPGVVPPAVSGAVDYDDHGFDDAFCVDDVANALGLPAARDPDALDAIFELRQDVSDDDLAAYGAQLAAVDLGCATGMCGLPTGD